MTLERYRKNINLHAVIALVIGSISLVICALTQFTNVFPFAKPGYRIQMVLAIVAVLIALMQYLYTRNILKKRLLSLVNSDSLEHKVDRYFRLMLQTFYMSALSILLIALICLHVYNTLLVCLGGLVLLFSVMLLRPSAYRMKIDLDLSDKDMEIIYGKNWNK